MREIQRWPMTASAFLLHTLLLLLLLLLLVVVVVVRGPLQSHMHTL